VKMAKKIKVAILGGGIGGLSAAHELAELGGDFEVHVYEGNPSLGGKARSQLLAGTGKGGRGDLPGEHGFRFFPAWYRHIPDAMRRIPRPEGGSVLDNLMGCTEMGLAEVDAAEVYRLKRYWPSTAGDWFDVLGAVLAFYSGTSVAVGDMARFGNKMLDFMLLCEERRRDQYEDISFFDFLNGGAYSTKFQRYLNSSRFMVAMDARRGSACTIGNKVVQILLDFMRPKGQNDRVLNGPTTSQWLGPWVSHLRDQGVHFHLGREVAGFNVDTTARRITGVRLAGQAEPVVADHYIAALPLERMQACLDDHLALLDGGLLGLCRAKRMTAWMVGAQYYLREDVPICDGHVAYPDAPWALSSISQASFWNRGREPGARFEDRYGDGSVKGVLSIDICDWEAVSPRLGKSAAQCTSREEVLAEAWAQLKEAVNGSKGRLLDDANVVRAHLDEGITFSDRGADNPTPLLVHPPGSWFNRPGAELEGIHNLFLAADYVQTETDLATMEGANEAARLAVNGLLKREGRSERVALIPLREEAGALIERAKRRDRKAWVEERRALPPLVPPLGPFRDEDGPTLEDARRYQDRVEEALRALAP
jgi:15-cis-phytoene desaturase